MDTIIEGKGLHKQFGNKVIFHEFDLEIKSGEFISVIGKSGCGKSTLLNIIGALEPYEKGIVLFNGKRMPSPQSKEATILRRKHINYLFQSYALVTNLSVKDNLELALKYTNYSTSKKKALIETILERVGLENAMNEKVIYMSGGEQQRVAIARALLKPCNVILADEPTGALDNKTANKVFELLHKMSKEYGRTVLMVTHNKWLAEKTDRIVSL